MGSPTPFSHPTVGWACLALLLLAAPATARGIEVTTGGCRFEVPQRHIGIVDELSPACGARLDEMRAQLGADPEREPIPVRVVVRSEDLLGAAPPSAHVPKWAAAYAVPSLPLVVVALRNHQGAPNLELSESLSHELSHVVMYEVLKGKEVPRWFSEGVAVQQSEPLPIERFLVLLAALRGRRLVPLAQLERYPVHAGHVNLAYAEAADFVGFLLRREGWMGVRHALRRTAAGDDFQRGIGTAFHADLAQLERLWLRGLPTTATWIQLLTGDGLLWGFASMLLILAYIGARKRHRLAMARLAAEDELADLRWSMEREEPGDRRH